MHQEQINKDENYIDALFKPLFEQFRRYIAFRYLMAGCPTYFTSELALIQALTHFMINILGKSKEEAENARFVNGVFTILAPILNT